MKLLKYLTGVLTLLLFLSMNTFAQEEEDMDEEQWQNEMNRLQQQRTELQQERDQLQGDVQRLKGTEIKSFDECMDELYAMVGATRQDIDNFRREASELNGRIQRKEGPKADVQKSLEGLQRNRVSALPEFFDRVHNQMPNAMDAWQEAPTEINYTVVRGDHLWGIAKKGEHYGNPFAWPKIYAANRDQIKNPDLIYPKQIFKIPNLTEEEKSKYDKLRRNYKPAPPQQEQTQQNP